MDTLLVSLLAVLGLGAVGTVIAANARQGRTRSRVRLIPKYYDIRHCDNTTSMRIFDVSKHMAMDGVEYVNMEMEMYHPLKTIRTLSLTSLRCTGGTAPHQCEFFNRWSWSVGICGLIRAPNMVWTPGIESITPAFRCPVAPGRKHVRNATLDVRVLQRYAVKSPVDWEKYIWPWEFQLIDGDGKPTFCIQGTSEIRRIVAKA